MAQEKDFNEEVARYIAAYTSLPEEARDYKDAKENLTFNQLLGLALLDSLDSDHWSDFHPSSYHEPDDGVADGIDLNAALGFDEGDPMLRDAYKFETAEELALRQLKRHGYKFTANSMIDLGLETKRLDEWRREIDRTGEEPSPSHAAKHSPRAEYPDTFAYNVTPEVSCSRDHEGYLVQLLTKSGFYVEYDVLEDTFFIEMGDESPAQDSEKLAEILPQVADVRIETDRLPYSFYVDKDAAKALRAIIGALTKHEFVGHVSAQKFKETVEEHSQAQGHKR